MTFTIITLDLDDTLWDNKPTLRYAEDVLYKWLQDYAPAISDAYSCHDLKIYRTELAKKRPQISHDMTLLRHRSLIEIAAEHGYEKDIADNAMEVFLDARNRVTLYEDVLPFLEQARITHKLVALSNGNANLHSIGLADYFSLCLSPADVGSAKPDPAMFHRVFEQLGAEPQRVIHVGDEPKTDVLGAQNAGVRNIWLNRNATPFPEEIPPADMEIQSLYDLLPLHEQLQRICQGR